MEDEDKEKVEEIKKSVLSSNKSRGATIVESTDCTTSFFYVSL